MYKKLLAAACGLGLIGPIQAQDYLDEIVVTASRLPQPLAQTLLHSTIITERELRASLAPDLPTLLRQQAGIEITQMGGLGTQSSVFLRGANSNQTLILLDGQRIGSASTGATALDQIMLADIERIEIVRGNVSALYGTDAIGGVIQIFTRQGRGTPAGRLAAGLGSHGEWRLAASYGGAFGDTRLHLGVSRLNRDGFSAARPEFVPTPFVFSAADTDVDGYRNTTLSMSLDHRLSLSHSLGLDLRASHGKVAYDGTNTNRSEQDLDRLQLTSRHGLWQGASGRLALGVSQDALDSFLDAAPKSRLHTRNRQAAWQLTQTLAPGHDLGLELGWWQQRLSSDQNYTRSRRELASAALSYAGRAREHHLQLAARRDDYSDFGAHGTWLAAYGYDLTPAWRLSASAATAFRAPSFNDLYNPAWGGNPALRPEKARSRELGLQYVAGPWRARLQYFDTRTRDLVVYQWPMGNVNIGRARSDGWEFTLDGMLAEWRIGLNATWQGPRDETTGQRLLRRAQRLGGVRLARDWGKGGLWLELKASGAREDVHVTNFNRTRVAGYGVINASGHYELAKNVRLEGRIDNLLDRDYSLVHGYQTPGRSLYLGLSAAF